MARTLKNTQGVAGSNPAVPTNIVRDVSRSSSLFPFFCCQFNNLAFITAQHLGVDPFVVIKPISPCDTNRDTKRDTVKSLENKVAL